MHVLFGAHPSRVASPDTFCRAEVVPEREIDSAARGELQIGLRANGSFDFRPQILIGVVAEYGRNSTQMLDSHGSGRGGNYAMRFKQPATMKT